MKIMFYFLYSDCHNLRKAIKGLGTNEKMLIHILGNRSNDQRLQIRDKYKTMFGRVKEIIYSDYLIVLRFIFHLGFNR